MGHVSLELTPTLTFPSLPGDGIGSVRDSALGPGWPMLSP